MPELEPQTIIHIPLNEEAELANIIAKLKAAILYSKLLKFKWED